jgi:hypothetical protein
MGRSRCAENRLALLTPRRRLMSAG